MTEEQLVALEARVKRATAFLEPGLSLDEAYRLRARDDAQSQCVGLVHASLPVLIADYRALRAGLDINKKKAFRAGWLAGRGAAKAAITALPAMWHWIVQPIDDLEPPP